MVASRGSRPSGTPSSGASKTPGLHSSVPFVTFTHVTMEDCLKLKGMGISQRRRYLAVDCMKIDHDEATFPWDIAADFHLHNWNFAQKHEFDDAKTSTFLSRDG